MLRVFIHILIIIILSGYALKAQTISGIVKGTVDGKKESIVGAVVMTSPTNATTTDVKGQFELTIKDGYPTKLITLIVGFQPDTITITSQPVKPIVIELESSFAQLNTVQIVKEQDGTLISYQTRKTEIINQKELKKAACCNLGESFETNASVDIAYKDAVSGSKEIQVLGLAGAYVQLLSESAPLINGLGLTYGLTSIPGTLINTISVVKGPGSVVFGHESMSGMVNVDFKDPLNTHKTFINAYLENSLRKELNIDQRIKTGDHSAMLLSFHGSHYDKRIDQNKDQFLDMPLLTHAGLLAKWRYDHRGLMSQNSIKLHYSDRKAGQTFFDFDNDKIDSSIYAQRLLTNRIEVYGRTGKVLNSEKYKSIGLAYSGYFHDQRGFYGFRGYHGKQENISLRFMYTSYYNENNELTGGLSYKYDRLHDRLDTFNFVRDQNVPGVFFENKFEKDKVIALIVGARADVYNNRVFVTPRTNFKYSLAEKTDLRASFATGWKLTDMLAEYPNIAASTRKILITETLNPEESYNYGVNLNHEFELWFKKGSFGADFYQTKFFNKVYADFDSIPATVLFYNLKNKTTSTNVQLELSYELVKNLEFKVAYKYLDVYSIVGNKKFAHPLIAKHRALANLYYETFNRKWTMNATYQWYGSKRLPSTLKYPEAFQKEGYSSPFSKVNMQINRIYKNSEWYIGVENLLIFYQQDAIMSADDPYGPYFDTGFVWGTLDNQRIYLGWRYKIE